MEYRIEAGDRAAVVVEVGGGLRTFEVAGQEITDGYGPGEIAPSGAGQVLAPWPNRIRDGRYAWAGQTYQLAQSEPVYANAIHGLVRWVPWRLPGRARSPRAQPEARIRRARLRPRTRGGSRT